MHAIQKIVVGVCPSSDDKSLSSGSKAAIHQAVWLSKLQNAELRLVHSTDKDVYYDPVIRDLAVVSEGLPPEGRKILEDLCQELRGMNIQTTLHLGDQKPWIEIIREVLRWKADLVVVGRQDTPMEGRHKLGHISRRLLRKSPVPVWVVRPDHDRAPKCILAATDLTPVGTRATQSAAFLALRTEAELHVVHSFQIPLALHMSHRREPGETSADSSERIAQQARQAIDKELAGSGMSEKANVHVVCDSPEGGILQAVNKFEPDLLVMGSISRSGLAGALMGNTAESLVGEVNCSLYTIKPADFVSPVTLQGPS